MKRLLSLLFVLVLCACCSIASAAVYNLTPPDPDLDDLDHNKYYTWGMDRPWEPQHDNVTETLAGAWLHFDDIRNWDSGPNTLYIHLLDDAPLGITTGTDNEGGGDAFLGQGVHLITYINLPSTPQDITYMFTDPEVAALEAYALNKGRYAIALDPDCHFYNNGVELELVTQIKEIPEPATVGLLLTGVAVGLFRRGGRALRASRQTV